MLQKLRSRHSIDLPIDGWKRSNGLLTVIGGLAFLAVILPSIVALVQGALTWATGVLIGLGTIVLVFLAMGAMGVKPGYNSIGRGHR